MKESFTGLSAGIAAMGVTVVEVLQQAGGQMLIIITTAPLCAHTLIALLSGFENSLGGLQKPSYGFQFSHLFSADVIARLGAGNMVVLVGMADRCGRINC